MIWNRAKGKERDALLWGDEVSILTADSVQPLNDGQVEYLVVTFDEHQQKVRLSLRQADILQSLAQDEKLLARGGCVPDIQNVEGSDLSDRLSKQLLTSPGMIHYQYSTLSLADLC